MVQNELERNQTKEKQLLMIPLSAVGRRNLYCVFQGMRRSSYVVFCQVKGREWCYELGGRYTESYQRAVWRVFPDSEERMRVCQL